MSFPKFLKIGVIASFEMVNNTIKEMELHSRVTRPFIKLLAQAVGFSYKFYAEDNGDIGDPLPDGNWTGLIGHTQLGAFDMIGHPIVLLGHGTQAVGNAVHLIYPIDILRVTFMTRKPEYVSDAAAILRPFSFNVWIAIIVCLTVMPLMFYLMERKRKDFQRHVMYTLEIILQRSSAANSTKGVMIALWLIPMTLLGFFYLSQLLSFLTIPTLTGVRTINELADAVAEGNYECISTVGNDVLGMLLQSDNPAFQAIGRDLEKEEYDESEMNISHFHENTKSLKKPALLILMSPIRDILKKKYFVSEDSFFPALIAIATRRDFCCTEKIDQAILRINAAGLYNKILEDLNFNFNLRILGEVSGEEDAERKLTMTDFKTVFIFLVAGNTLALIVLLIEIMFAKYSKKSERKPKNVFIKVVKINVSD